jgi:hypothetical protein
MEQVLAFILAFAAKYPAAATVIFFMGTARLFMKPIVTCIKAIVELTETKKDDEKVAHRRPTRPSSSSSTTSCPLSRSSKPVSEIAIRDLKCRYKFIRPDSLTKTWRWGQSLSCILCPVTRWQGRSQMTTVVTIISFLTTLMKFLPEVRKLLKLLSDTPEEKRAEIMEKIAAEEKILAETGRPKWD